MMKYFLQNVIKVPYQGILPPKNLKYWCVKNTDSLTCGSRVREVGLEFFIDKDK